MPQDDPMQRQPDISRAKEILDWEPKVHRSKGLKKYMNTLNRYPMTSYGKHTESFLPSSFGHFEEAKRLRNLLLAV